MFTTCIPYILVSFSVDNISSRTKMTVKKMTSTFVPYSQYCAENINRLRRSLLQLLFSKANILIEWSLDRRKFAVVYTCSECLCVTPSKCKRKYFLLEIVSALYRNKVKLFPLIKQLFTQ